MCVSVALYAFSYCIASLYPNVCTKHAALQNYKICMQMYIYAVEVYRDSILWISSVRWKRRLCIDSIHIYMCLIFAYYIYICTYTCNICICVCVNVIYVYIHRYIYIYLYNVAHILSLPNRIISFYCAHTNIYIYIYIFIFLRVRY